MNGLLLVDKPQGYTSHDVVAVIRRRLTKGVKVGHSGTLDPMATGLLVLLIGKATKSAADYQKKTKVYTGTIRFGAQTDTGDLDASEIREFPVPDLAADAIKTAMSAHLGSQEMPPPMYSAVKYKGKPLYKYARQGVEVPLRKRTFEVFEWDLTGWAKPEVSFRLFCSHGTYARSLAVALGDKLACPSVLSSLRREKIGDFALAQAVSLDAACGLSAAELESKLIPV